MLTKMPVRFETSEEDPWLMGALVRRRPDRGAVDASRSSRMLGAGSGRRPRSATMTAGKNHTT